MAGSRRRRARSSVDAAILVRLKLPIRVRTPEGTVRAGRVPPSSTVKLGEGRESTNAACLESLRACRRRLAALLGFGVGVGVVLLAALTAGATFPGASGRISFASDGEGDLDNNTMNPDSSGAASVTADPNIPGFDLEPDWSPNGTKIAFRSGRSNAGRSTPSPLHPARHR